MIVQITLLALAILFVLSVLKNVNAIGLFIFIEFFFPSDIGIVSLLSLNVSKIAFLIFFIYVILVNRNTTINKYPAALLWLPVLFVVIMFVPFVNSNTEKGPVVQLLVYEFPKYFVPGILLFFSIKTYNDLISLTKWIVILVLIWTTFNVYEFISKGNFFIDELIKEFPKAKDFIIKGYEYNISSARFGISLRAQATVFHPIGYGGRINLLLCVLLFFSSLIKENFISKKLLSRFFKLGINVAIFCVLIASLLTFSRSVWIFTFLTFVIYFFCYSNHKKTILAITIPLLLCGIIFGGIYFIKLFDVKGSSVSMRLDQFNAVLRIVGDNYIWGQGYNSVENYLTRYGEHTDAFGFESFLFYVLLNYGLVGISFYVIFFVNTFRGIYKSKLRPLIYFSFYTSLPYLVFILVTGEMQTIWLYWLVINLVAACITMLQENYSIAIHLKNYFNAELVKNNANL